MSKPGVLFRCASNDACRQMVEAVLRKHAAEQFGVLSSRAASDDSGSSCGPGCGCH